MWVLAPAVTSLILMVALHPPYTHRNSLRPHQIHSHINVYFYSISYIIPFIPLLNLHPTTHAWKSFSLSLKLFFNTKPTDKHQTQNLLRSSCRLLPACITGALWAKLDKHGISLESFSFPASRFALVLCQMPC